ncbi:hypothetical protein A0H81_05039 [Grifola frondosa]|uniref:Uncharacterized protein n=1 Tax=Grifola frondosa TaxID=5627 RepID=A0A1C7MCR1_GRIFR|nr:hypothetical protein A0H81_05039 [Grifola frondosa]
MFQLLFPIILLSWSGYSAAGSRHDELRGVHCLSVHNTAFDFDRPPADPLQLQRNFIHLYPTGSMISAYTNNVTKRGIDTDEAAAAFVRSSSLDIDIFSHHCVSIGRPVFCFPHSIKRADVSVVLMQISTQLNSFVQSSLH